jgi:integrase
MGVKVRERPKGSGDWWVFIDHQGDRKAKKIGRDKRLAVDVAKKIEARLVLGDLELLESKEKIPYFNDYCQLWLDDYIKPTRRSTTYQRYTSVLKLHVGPIIGKIPLDQIKRSHIRNALLNISKKGLSKSTVSMARNVISGTIEYAMEEELVTTNPTNGVLKKLGLDSRSRPLVQPMTPDEVALFLGTCSLQTKKWYPFFLCAFRTGMRLGELLGLRWGDIDWTNKSVQVQRSFRHGKITGTKTRKSRRVDMSDQLVGELRGLLTKRKKEAIAAGTGKVVETIFHTDGNPTSQNTIRNIWKRLLKKTELRNMRFHDIRHTYASLLLSRGESPVYVKEQLGHSSIQMTVDIYGHLIPGGNRQAVNALDDSATNRNLSATTKN